MGIFWQQLLIFFGLSLLSVISPQAIALDDSPVDQVQEDKKIQYLLDKVKNSKAVFLRNGDEHTALEAHKHLKSKMERARRSFGFWGELRPMSVQIFINKIASKSSFSGKDYKMRLKDGRVLTTNEWLNTQLQIYLQKSQKMSSNKEKNVVETVPSRD